MNYKMIINILGWVLKIEAISMIIPLICALCYGETGEIYIFAISIAICLIVGFLISRKTPRHKSFFAKEGFVTVALSWIVMSIFGSLPFLISGSISNPFDAFFETVSGFTTTGASILTDVESLPKSLLMWRSLTHWIGGMGVLVFLMAILPLSGSSNLFLLRAESPGPSVNKLVPKVKSTAMILYGIYIVMTFVEVLLLLGGGLNLFESLTLSFGTAGTGGFSVLNSGLNSYTPYVQYVIAIFMVLFGVDFGLYHILFLKEAKSSILKSGELKCYFAIIITSITLILINCQGIFKTFEEAFRSVFFTVASIISSTGYGTADFNMWPDFSKSIIVLLMFIGACAGSTGGGIKVSRIMILFKSIAKEIKTCAHPRNTLKIKMNGRIVEHETVRGVNVYIAAFASIFVMSILIISLDNFGFTTNFTAILATMNNIGPGLDMIGPTGNYSAFSNLSKFVMSFCMLAGRLEIFPMLVLFSPSTWRK